MRILELFSGTGSVGHAFELLGWRVTSLDILPGATITSDILDWDYAAHAPEGFYDFIWASPPCTHYSIARTKALTPRDFELADSIVNKTLEIIEYFNPTMWLIENPQTGYLKTRPMMQGLPWWDLTYCKYGFPYKKKTRIWGVLPTFAPTRPCSKEHNCEHIRDGKHPAIAQRGTTIRTTGHTLRELYSIPPDLCDEIAFCATIWLPRS